MDDPLVSILVVNYNSAPIIHIVKELVMSIKASTYGNVELVLLDNGSVDGSFEEISRYVRQAGLNRFEIQRAPANLGFTGGNNLAYRYADPRSKYLVLLNNDAVLDTGALRLMIRKLEDQKGVGAASGISIRYDRPVLDGSIWFVNEMYNSVGPPSRPFTTEGAFSETVQTYPYGAGAFIRREVLDDINEDGKIFDDELFMYADDVLLGFKLWNRGKKVMFYPVLCTRHKGGGSSDSGFRAYHALRGRAAVSEALITRWKRPHELFLRRMLISAILKRPAMAAQFVRAVDEGLTIGRRLRLKYGLDFYRAPVITVSATEVLERLALPTRISNKRAYEDLPRLMQVVLGGG